MKRKAGSEKWCGRRKGYVGLSLLLLALLVVAYPADAALRIGSALPPVTLPGIDGASVRIPESLEGDHSPFLANRLQFLQAGDARHG